MRVALDATPLQLTSGGIARYTAELGRALAGEYPGDRFDLVPPGRRLWWSLGAARLMRHYDLFHGTNFEVPYLPLKPSVMTLHDLSPWMDPAWHHAADRVRRRTPWLLRVATMVVTPTEAVRRHALERFRLNPARVVAVPHAASPLFRPVDGPRGNYFLFVGTLEPRKNVPLLLTAWREVRRRHDVDLWLVGRTREDFSELSHEPGLRLLGEVPDEDLPSLYSGAQAVVYPSQYEGFGLPALEAMQCGALVITSRDAALMEVAGEASIAGADAAELATLMQAALENPAWAAACRERSLRRAAEFSWPSTARQTRAVYDEALRRFAA